LQRESPALCRLEADPASCENAEKVPMAKDHDRALGPARHTLQYAVHASPDLSSTFSTRAAVHEDVPTGELNADLRGGQALIAAVVPLHELGIDLDITSEPCELTGLDRPTQWTDKDPNRCKALETRLQRPSVPDAVLLEGKIRPSGVTTTLAPARRGVPDEDNSPANRYPIVRIGCFKAQRSSR
jgi:hypothetical protein